MPRMWSNYQVTLFGPPVAGRFMWKLEPCKPTDRVSRVSNERHLTSVTHAHMPCYHVRRCSQLWIPSLIHYKPKHSPKNCITKVKCSPSWPAQSHKSICYRQVKEFSREGIWPKPCCYLSSLLDWGLLDPSYFYKGIPLKSRGHSLSCNFNLSLKEHQEGWLCIFNL